MTDKEQLLIFNNWLSQHKGIFFKIIRAYALTEMDREDLFQEISLQVWHSIPRFRQESAASTWLYRIALNTAIRWTKKERRQLSGNIEDTEHLLTDQPGAIDERLAWLYDTIQQLDPIDRSVTLLLLDGYSYREMAGILGITESNVGVKINRIKKRLAAESKKTNQHGVY